MFKKKTIADVNVKGKRVLLRADYNVPLTEFGTIGDDYRITQSIPTIKNLQKQGAKIVIISHLGRPENEKDVKFSLAPVAKHLSQLLGEEVKFLDETVGKKAVDATKELEPKQIILLENLRFNKGEKANDAKFAKQLAELGDVFVQDGFGVVHRADASTDKVTKYFKQAVAGDLLAKEVETITKAMEKPKRPMGAVIGGAKITDKIELLHKFIEIADFVAVGGAMANTFLMAEGVKVGASLYEAQAVATATEVLNAAKEKASKQKFEFFLPVDGVVTTAVDNKKKTRVVDWWSHSFSEINSYPKIPSPEAYEIAEDEMIVDVGPMSAQYIAGAIQMTNTFVWNGTVGIAEIDGISGASAPFGHGSRVIFEALGKAKQHSPFSIVGGGDTASYVMKDRDLAQNTINHISTGGGASLELMAGHKLPGVEALNGKK